MAFTTKADFLQRAATRLAPVDAVFDDVVRTDYDLNKDWPAPDKSAYRKAAVLCGLLDRGEDFGVLLTLRPDTMPSHAGQVAFPGGRLETGETGLAAALREAYEEVGVEPATVRVLGQGDTYLTGSGFAISPFVGIIPADFAPRPDPREVADVFETPLSFLMNPANHERHEREFRGALRAYYAMPHNGRYIWGATAGMLKSLYDRLYGAGER
ncbi:MAG TPA: CoA pyrophosphatase [Hyphomonadaceae bacterium]|nr:CoA pyrophosphatase [Hyphomonadaceae bacterium]